MRTSIDKGSVIPYYVQLRDALEEQIRSGSWKPGDKLPGEMELCERFDVSRTVVRQALKEMSYAGVIRREKGRGTFVSEPKISSSATTVARIDPLRFITSLPSQRCPDRHTGVGATPAECAASERGNAESGPAGQRPWRPDPRRTELPAVRRRGPDSRSTLVARSSSAIDLHPIDCRRSSDDRLY